MFKNLSTSRKLFILCSMFVIALGVTTYSLVTEKLIAIEFARKELAGNRYLDTIRRIYQAVLIGRSGPGGTASSELSSDSLLAALAAAEAETDGRFQTAALEQTLAAKLEALWSSDAPRGGSDDPIVDAVAAARDLAQRIGDDSNLTLDPDLDTYYVQNIIVKALPTLLGQLGELAMLTPEVTAAAAPQASHTRLLVLDGLLRASTEAIGDDLASAYRGNADGRLKSAVDPSFAALIAATNSYADASAAGPAGASASLSGTYASAVERAMSAWIVAGRELDRLLGQRIDELVLRLETSLLVTAVLGGLSILIAVLTHRHIVKPLERFESVARTIREMKIYSLRVDEGSSDEIGRLAASFNAMLAELADAREREITEQSELARVTRSTAMGAMTASIAHEINQPLAAIVTNSNAALRWLGNAAPNVEEARAALKRISADGHRAGEIISGIRAMFKRDASHRVAIDTNELIREVLLLANTTLQAQRAMVETDLREGLAEVLGDRVQLQQVFLNLIINAAESMGSVTDRARFLLVRSDVDDHGGVLVAVADSGTGIAQQDLNRVFEAFFTTKASGMGMGLFICRSIIESHGGRLWAAPRFPHGTVFYVALPPETAVEE